MRVEAQRLQAEGVDILIALGHSGYELDQQLAEEVEEIDVVVGGHSHTFLWSGMTIDSIINRQTQVLQGNACTSTNKKDVFTIQHALTINMQCSN